MSLLDDLKAIANSDKERDETRLELDFKALREQIDSIDDEDKLVDILMSVASDPGEDEKYIVEKAVPKIKDEDRQYELIMNASLYVAKVFRDNGCLPSRPGTLARMMAAMEAYK